MKIVADENIPYVREAFCSFGDVETLAGRDMTAGIVRDADLLLVRSITKVNAGLLDGSKVRFAATATIGEDHIDKEYLAGRGIGFSSAPGSNANSVGQYITSALLSLASAYDLDLREMRMGIVGVGNVGKRVLRKASALGLQCVLNDPPLERQGESPTSDEDLPEFLRTYPKSFAPLDELFDCDVVTLHVPLTKDGDDATFHLADESFLSNMKPGSILINTSRGAVVDNGALLRVMDSGHLKACVLDVWEGEPKPNCELLDKTFIATPHIAGYSFDGKVNGTRQIYEAACAFLGVEPAWDPTPILPAPECPEVAVDGNTEDIAGEVRKAVFEVYDIGRDDADMRCLLDVADEERGKEFDLLRKGYPRRREFFNTVAKVEPPNDELSGRLSAIGFSA